MTRPLARTNNEHYSSCMERVITAAEASTDFLGILKQVARGDRVVITRRGRPRAVLLGNRYGLRTGPSCTTSKALPGTVFS